MESDSNVQLANPPQPSPPSPRPRTAAPLPTLVEAIAARAYEMFLGRGSAHGHEQDDWTTATWDVIADTLG